LIAFPGVVLVVSHDRYFLNRVCTHMLAFEGDGRVLFSVGNYDYYAEKRTRLAAQPAAAPATSAPKGKAACTSPAPARPRRLSYKEARELETIEPAILAAEETIARIEALFAEADFHRQHGPRTNELLAELAAEKERVARLYERWQELDALRATPEKASRGEVSGL
jgi:ATP-binding cassette subfamily F protein uup